LAYHRTGMAQRALRLYAGPTALSHIERHGLQPSHIGALAGAAGGPKGLILGPLDRFIFGHWLADSSHTVHLLGASIGAWRMATACLAQCVQAFETLEDAYIRQDYELPPGQKRPTPEHVSERFAANLRGFYAGRVAEVLNHPRWHVHIITSRGRHLLARETALRTPLGYLGAFVTNTVSRRAMGAWLERVVFSAQHVPPPFPLTDYRSRHVALTAGNFAEALQASCSIPFVLRSVRDIEGAPPGAYWDGGITDYHLHLNYARMPHGPSGHQGLVLYPHFQKSVVPGWLDKSLKWRHRSSSALSNVLVLAPDPAWVATLPGAKLPDRTDFTRFGTDLAGRVKAWTAATAAAKQLADEFAQWLERPDVARVEAL
jgi:hypothetical protein